VRGFSHWARQFWTNLTCLALLVFSFVLQVGHIGRSSNYKRCSEVHCTMKGSRSRLITTMQSRATLHLPGFVRR